MPQLYFSVDQDTADELARRILLCSVVKAELLYGARKSQRVAQKI